MPLTSSCPARKGSHTPALCPAAAQLAPYQMDRGLPPPSHTYCKKKKGGNSEGRGGAQLHPPVSSGFRRASLGVRTSVLSLGEGGQLLS